jgi:hypothetical protein
VLAAPSPRNVSTSTRDTLSVVASADACRVETNATPASCGDVGSD